MQESVVFLVRVQCRCKESSRSLSHLLMSFLFSSCICVFYYLSFCINSAIGCCWWWQFTHHTWRVTLVSISEENTRIVKFCRVNHPVFPSAVWSNFLSIYVYVSGVCLVSHEGRLLTFVHKTTTPCNMSVIHDSLFFLFYVPYINFFLLINLLIDHSRSGALYYFSRVCLYVC